MRYAPKHTFGRYHFYTILCPSCLAGAPLVPMHIYLQLSGYGVQSLSKARTLRMYRRHAYAPACSCQMSAGSHMWAPPCIRVCKYCGMLAESVRSPRMCTSAPCRTILNHHRNHLKCLQLICIRPMRAHVNPVGTILNHLRNHLKCLQIICIRLMQAHLNPFGTILNHPRNHLKVKEASHKTRIASKRTVSFI